MTTRSRTLDSLTVSERLLAGSLALLLGLSLLWGVAFAASPAIHNGAHDARHAVGFPCH